jgi:hypothetical protein
MMKESEKHSFEPYFYNRFPFYGKFDIPTLEKQEIHLSDLKLIRFSDIIKKETRDLDATVHFFIFDDEFDEVWKKPAAYIEELRQYRQVITTDFSLYTNMSLALQIFNIYRNRWLGCYWQEQGLTVIPSVGWSDELSFEFCFDGIQEGSTVAVSTLGSYDIEDAYLKGFQRLCEAIKPDNVICYAKPFAKMFELANIIEIPYVANARTAPIKNKVA